MEDFQKRLFWVMMMFLEDDDDYVLSQSLKFASRWRKYHSSEEQVDSTREQNKKQVLQPFLLVSSSLRKQEFECGRHLIFR